MQHDILIVGSGLSGAVLAERFATILNKRVLILEKRDHIGGNIYDYIDEETNILMSKYGAHLFHTNNDKVWEYINRFSRWIRWDHQVVGKVENKLVNIPVNINTVNALQNENIRTTEEMDEWLKKTQIKYDKIENSEQMGKSRVGEDLYNKLFRDYTFKQWSKYPEELDASVLARIPIRNNFDNRYFDDKYQALPEKGYTEFVKKMLDHPNIDVQINTNFLDFMKGTDELKRRYEHIIFTGPIDQYYADKGMEQLEYRSIEFIIERYMNMNYYQPNSVVNYPEPDVPFTRIVEYKHFLNQESEHTVIVKEITKETGEPYYPIPNKRNMELYEKYRELAKGENKVHFIGRLANYKYFNMDAAILNALEYFENTFSKENK
jgi:UDP-galactopyranose mutase